MKILERSKIYYSMLQVVPKVEPLHENLNRAMFDTLVARNVDEALAVLRLAAKKIIQFV